MKGLILVTGSDGLVGSRFVEISKCGNKFFTPKRVEFDITDPVAIKELISSYDISALVNFAAYTEVGKAEVERGDKNGTCWQVNVEGVKNLVEAVRPYGDKIHFIQISTDMVFPGSKRNPGPYAENHFRKNDLESLTWYGYTKSLGEDAVVEVLGDMASIVRIIYPVRASFEAKEDYIRKMLNLYDQGMLYPLFSDQQISITYIDELCTALDQMISKNIRGIFHVSSCDTVTPFDLMTEVVEKIRSGETKLKSTSLDAFYTQNMLPEYRYPRFGGLSVTQTEEKLDIKFSSWKEIVDKLAKQDIGKKHA